jgi:hypothetical protein
MKILTDIDVFNRSSDSERWLMSVLRSRCCRIFRCRAVRAILPPSFLKEGGLFNTFWYDILCSSVHRSLHDRLTEHAGMAHLYDMWWGCVMTGWLWLGG